jgi:uncharacterized protein YkwD
MQRGLTARLSRRLFVAAALQAALVLAAPAPAADGDPISTALIRVNQFRGDHGLLPVTLDARLSAAALRHARAMADQDFFSHVGADGSRMGGRLTEAGYVWRVVAENLAAGMADPREAVRVWIDSPGHRHNLLLKDAIHAGFGHVHIDPDPGSVRYRHYWVLMLAAPRPGH